MSIFYKPFILTICLHLLASSANAQHFRYAIDYGLKTFVKSISDKNDQATTILYTINEEIATQDPGSGKEEFYHFTDHLSHFDKNGNLADHTVIADGRISDEGHWDEKLKAFQSLIYDQSGNGYSLSCDSKCAYVEKKTPMGRPIWQKKYPTKGIDRIKILTNGEVWVIGQMDFVPPLTPQNEIEYPVKLPAIQDSNTYAIWVHKLNKDGQSIGFQAVEIPFLINFDPRPDRYGDSYPHISFKIDPHGNSYIYGHLSTVAPNSDKHQYIKVGDWQQEIYPTNSFLIKIDPSGKPMFSKVWDNFPQYLKHIEVDAKGNMYLSGFYAQVLDIGKRELIDYHGKGLQMFLAKFSPQGELLWQKTFGSGNFDEIKGMMVSPNGHIHLLTGLSLRAMRNELLTFFDQCEVISAPSNIRNYHQIGVLWSIDTDGETTSRKFVRGKNWYCRQMIPIGHHGFMIELWHLFKGTMEFDGMSFAGEKEQSLLLRYDFEESTSKLASSPTPLLKVFPNTSPDRFQLSLGAAFSGEVKLSVADASGRTILQRTLHKEEDLLQTEIDLGRFAEGAYVLHLSDGWETASKKLVVKK